MKVFVRIVCFILFVTSLNNCVFQGKEGFYIGEKDSCGFAVNQWTGKGIKWDKSHFPISFLIHHSVSSSARKNFVSAVGHWNLAWESFLIKEGLEPFPLFAVKNKNMKYSGSPGNDSYNLLFFINNNFSEYENSMVQAITAVSTDRAGEIKDTDIIVNNESFKYFYDESYNKEILLSQKQVQQNRRLASLSSPSFWFRFKEQIKKWFQFLLRPFQKKHVVREIARVSPKVPRGYVDFSSLMIHELGHTPGLAHFDKSGHSSDHNRRASQRGSASQGFVSVMEPKLASGRARRAIGEYDLRNLFCGYFGY